METSLLMKLTYRKHLGHILLIILLIFGLIATSCKEHKAEIEEVSSENVLQLQIPDSLSQAIDTLVKNSAAQGHARMLIKYGRDGGESYYYGYDGRSSSEIEEFNGYFQIGSATKMFTATSIMQLIEEGKLGLDTPLVQLLDKNLWKDIKMVMGGIDYNDSIRVKNLLNHTSGLPDYFIEESDEAEFVKNGDPSLHFSTTDLIDLSRQSKKERFKPGEKWEYSNINYTLLGEIISKLSGMTYQGYIQKHILDPLKMENTYFGTLNDTITIVDGHYHGDITEMPYSMAGAAGEIISTLDDLYTFIDAWYKGNLYKNPDTMKTILNENYNSMASGINYGLGVVNIQNQSWGHAGQTFGFQTYAASLPNGSRFVFYIDDASISSWIPAMVFSVALSSLE